MVRFCLIVFHWFNYENPTLPTFGLFYKNQTWHLDLKERSVKVRISYKVLHILSGWHYKTRDCRAVKYLLFSIWHFNN